MSRQAAIDKLVERIATEAADDKTPLDTATDALKALTGFLAMEKKKTKDTEPDEGEDRSFDNFRDDLKNAETDDGGTKVRSN